MPATPLLWVWILLGLALAIGRAVFLLPFRILLPGRVVEPVSSALSAVHEGLFDRDSLH